MTAPRLLTTAQVKSAEVTDTTATPTFTLANNTIYSCTNSAITTLTISGVVTGFEYATVVFDSGSTAAAVDVPSGWVCIGEDCNNNAFVPVASKSYNLAIVNRMGAIRVYVMEG